MRLKRAAARLRGIVVFARMTRAPLEKAQLGSQVRTGDLGQCLDIWYQDAAWIDALYDAAVRFQSLQLATDGLHAQAQIIRHLVACKRHDQLTALTGLASWTRQRCAPQDGKQQCCYLFSGRLAAEQKHPIARRVDGIECGFQKNLLEIGLLLKESFKICPTVATQLHLNSGFGCVWKLCPVWAAEKIPRK